MHFNNKKKTSIGLGLHPRIITCNKKNKQNGVADVGGNETVNTLVSVIHTRL
jgi:hypothetical protein